MAWMVSVPLHQFCTGFPGVCGIESLPAMATVVAAVQDIFPTQLRDFGLEAATVTLWILELHT